MTSRPGAARQLAVMNCVWCDMEGLLDEAGLCEECQAGIIGMASVDVDLSDIDSDAADDLLRGVQWSVQAAAHDTDGRQALRASALGHCDSSHHERSH